MNDATGAVKRSHLTTGRQAEKRAATRARLLAAARDLFLSDGFETTTTRAILDRAVSSKGAMYHHFDSKAEMLEDIFRDTSRAAIRRAGEAAGDGSYLDQLTRAAFAWLGELADDDTRRILVELGPEGLGWRRAEEIEDAHSIKALTALLTNAAEAGETTGTPPEISARLLNALLTEAAFVLSRTGGSAQPALEARIEGFIASLAK